MGKLNVSVAYCRVSTIYEEQKKSLEEQQKQWKDLAKDKNYVSAKCGAFYKRNGEKQQCPGLYVDEGITAKDYKHREAFKQMVEDAKAGKFNNIFVEDVTRFSRNAELGIKIYKDLRQHGVNVHFRKEGLDTMNVDNDYILTFAFGMAEKENQMRSERSKWGISRVHNDGRVNTTPPIGYRMKDPELTGGKKGVLEIDPQKAEVVKYIFYLYTEKLQGMHSIAQTLNKQNIKTKKGKIWSQETVRVVLKNELYIGNQIMHRTVSRDITRGERIEVPEDEQVKKEKEELRIIDDETWNKKEMILNERNKNLGENHGHSTKHILSTLMYCENCNSVFFRTRVNEFHKIDGTISGGNYEWVCMGRNHHGKDYCGGDRYVIDEEKMIAFLKRQLKRKQKEDEEYLLERYKNKKMEELDNIDIKALQEEEILLNKQMGELRIEKIKFKMDDDIYSSQYEIIHNKILDIKKQLKDFENIKKDIKIAELKYKEYKETLNRIVNEELTNEDLKKILNKIVVRGETVDKKKYIQVYLDYKFLDELQKELLREDEIDYETGLWEGTSTTEFFMPFIQ
ncbi:MAG: recombinase family protein [Clostridia bacterium]|nr:recombinase family protein [Clostridia bacterium]